MKNSNKKFNAGEALQVAGGAVAAGFVTNIVRKQEKLAKFADFVPLAAGFAVAYFAPKYAGVGYGMIGAGAVSLVAKKFPVNGQVIAYPETVTGEEINALPFGNVKMRFSNALKEKLAAQRGGGGRDFGAAMRNKFAQSFKPGASSVKMQPGIIAEHYADIEDCETDDGF
jgi:hypothetical protein